MRKNPMYMIGLSVAAFIGWKLLNETTRQFEEALAHPTDDDAVEAMEERYASKRRAGYLNPDKWHISQEEF